MHNPTPPSPVEGEAVGQEAKSPNEPDHIYDPDDWHTTYNWDDRDLMVADSYDLAPGGVKRFATLIAGPDKFAARVVLTRDDDGDPDETEIQWFDSEEAARKATGKP